MKWTFAFIAALALVVAAPAHAKGPSKVTITGPGLEEPLVVPGHDAMRVMEHSGFWDTATKIPRSGVLASRPSGDLGPKYVVAYEMPMIVGVWIVRQDVYPFANGGPVTHIAAGQDLFDRPTTGGWFRGGPALTRTLVSLGVPHSEPPSESRRAWAVVPLAALLLGVSLVTLRTMRRGGEPRAD